MDSASAPAAHWAQVYARGETTCSWFQAEPTVSLALLERCCIGPGDSVIDIGGGASTFVDALLARGHRDVTVLDIAAEPLQLSQQRLGSAAERVHWLVADLLTWSPERRWQLWHDGAVLHFLVSAGARDRYLHALHAATRPGAVAIFAVFAPDGPRSCSGLPVTGYSSRNLADLLGSSWQRIAADREDHITPDGRVQPFTWAGFRRIS